MAEGRHRVADGQVADTQAVLPDSRRGRAPGSGRQFTVQRLGGQWFIGLPGAAQRIDDAAALDSWLAANGRTDPRDLDFAGDRALEQRFQTDMSIAPPRCASLER